MLGFEHADDGEADRHQGRLGVLGERQLGLRPLPHELRKLLAERIIDFLENRARRGEARPAPCPCRPPGCPVPEK